MTYTAEQLEAAYREGYGDGYRNAQYFFREEDQPEQDETERKNDAETDWHASRTRQLATGEGKL